MQNYRKKNLKLDKDEIIQARVAKKIDKMNQLSPKARNSKQRALSGQDSPSRSALIREQDKESSRSKNSADISRELNQSKKSLKAAKERKIVMKDRARSATDDTILSKSME